MLASDLTATVSKVNASASASLGEPTSPLGAIVRILNSNLAALNQVRCGRGGGRAGQASSLGQGLPAEGRCGTATAAVGHLARPGVEHMHACLPSQMEGRIDDLSSEVDRLGLASSGGRGARRMA